MSERAASSQAASAGSEALPSTIHPDTGWIETLSDGSRVLIRPIKSNDYEIERDFIARMSPTARHFRFMGQVSADDAELIHKLVEIDSTRDVAYVALRQEDGHKREVAVARFCASPDGSTCECAVTVSEDWQHKGLGTKLVALLIDVARQRGIARMTSIDAYDNVAMKGLAEHFGFSRKPDPDDAHQVIHSLRL